MDFNPQLIDQIAADIFWGYSNLHDFQTAESLIREKNFSSLWTINKATEILRDLDPNFPDNEIQRFYESVNDYIFNCIVVEERNLIGTIYAEDFETCREPDFQYHDTLQKLENITYDNDSLYNESLEDSNQAPVIGELLIRPPLPAVALLKTDKVPPFIRVNDTNKALGFQKTLFLQISHLNALPANPQDYISAAAGVFFIMSLNENNKDWIKVIPNSVFTLKTPTLYKVS